MSFIKYLTMGTLGTGIVIIFYKMTYGIWFAIGDKMRAMGAPDNVILSSHLGFSLGILGLLIGLIIFMVLAATREEYETSQRF